MATVEGTTMIDLEKRGLDAAQRADRVLPAV